MLTLLVFIIILSVLIVVHEFGHFIMAKKVGVRVEKFSLGFGPVLVKRKKGDTEYSISAIPLGGYVKMAGDNLEDYKGKAYEYYSKSIWERFQIIFFGPLLNYVLGFLFFWLIFFSGYPSLTSRVGTLLDDFGAKDAGLKAQDKIVSIDGRKIALWEELQQAIQERKNKELVNLQVLREGKELTLPVKIKEKEMTDLLGQKRSIGLLGITPEGEIVQTRHGFVESFGLGIQKTLELTGLTYKGLWFMIVGRLSVRDSVTGPLGIFFITSKAASSGVTAVLHLIAVLSISLAIFNLLPLPILDGGHIFLLGLEKIRRKALSIKTERILTQAGLTFIIALALLVTFNDIVRLYGDKINKFFR